MPNYIYTQGVVADSPWKPAPISQKEKLLASGDVVFCTALAVSKLVDGIEPSEKEKLAYLGPFYLDWDNEEDLSAALEDVNAVMDKFREWGINLDSIAWYVTGKKGFHAEIPMELFVDGKLSKTGYVGLPHIYKEMVYELAIDSLDLRVYSAGRGRMWRVPNVPRPTSGKYKVQVTASELRTMNVQIYEELIQKPRDLIKLAPPEFNVELHLLFANAKQKVETRIKEKGTRKRDPLAKVKAQMPSVLFMMEGKGLKASAGFHEIAIQVAIAAVTAGLKPAEMVEKCQGLIENHQSDGTRYGSPAKRRAELLRLYNYMEDNPGYDFGVGAIKVLLNHEAPDLDNLPISKAEVEEVIKVADEAGPNVNADGEIVPDEYGDVAGGITLSKYGVYVSNDEGKKRLTALSFQNIHLLHSMETGQLSGYEAEILINGRSAGRQMLELDTFSSVATFNRFATRHGHAMQGAEPHVRGLMMRFVELGKKKGKLLYIAKREGLDVVNIPNHENEVLREPFMVYAAASGVLLDPKLAEENIEISYQGYPDPRGVFKTDLGDAPVLSEWLSEPGNKAELRKTLIGLLNMQSPDVVCKLIGWYVACIYRMLFHKGYTKFPLLHVNGPAGAGKTQMNITMASLFFYHQEPKVMSPASTLFALIQHMSGSTSVPFILDEYKPQDMVGDLHAKLKLSLRDAYNCRDITKGGGTRESDDYRVLHHTQLSAPICFIAEAAEEESAVAERVVLCTIVKPSSSMSLRQLAHFNVLDRNKQHLSILGSYLVTQAINESGVEQLRAEFDPLLTAAKNKYMLTDADLGTTMTPEELSMKQNSKERSVFNYTVVQFGLRKFRKLVDAIFPADTELADLFDKLDGAVYGRLNDLHTSTQAEWAKVLMQMAEMSWSIDYDSPIAVRENKEYAFIEVGGKEMVEVSARATYFKYRTYCSQHKSKALFAGDQSFLYALKDCPALKRHGTGDRLHQPGIYVFDVEKLADFGVTAFKRK